MSPAGSCHPLGKGIAAASIANILESYGYKISMLKLDPYLNVDPGTMSPFQHGESLCHRRRSGNRSGPGPLRTFHRINTQDLAEEQQTTGQHLRARHPKERRGDYLGKTVQVIPHVTDEIKWPQSSAASENAGCRAHRGRRHGRRH